MPWIRQDNVAMDTQADWSGYKRTVPNCSPEEARRIALLDPSISFFFFAREHMELAPRIFNPGDAVFFSGKPWWGSAPQSDGYLKDGISLAYIGSLDTFDPNVAGTYVTAQGLNAVDMVCLFAADLNVALSGNLIRLAPDVAVPAGGTLAVAPDYFIPMFGKSVQALQAKGITVILTFLNNHDAAGWSEFKTEADAQAFAEQLNYVVETYGFDGIDIDDEYSNGVAQDGTLAMVTQMMRALMPSKIISKALWADTQNFGPTYKGVGLAQTLTYGWYMGYGGEPSESLPDYAGFGMTTAALGMGFWTVQPSSDPAADVAWVKANGYAGVMVYAFEIQENQDLLGNLVNLWCGPGNWNSQP